MEKTMLRRTFLSMTLLSATAVILAPVAHAADGDIPGFDEAVKAGRPILIHVTAEWCPICHRQKPIVSDLLSKPEFKAIRKFEVDFDTRKDVLARFRVQTQATMIVFKGGEEIDRLAGQSDPAAIEALLREAL
jgi:thioredoxin 1